MRLPNPQQAIVDIAKLRLYCLNPKHPRGRHKARIFASRLGITEKHAERLREALLQAAIENEVRLGNQDKYGQRYVLDFEMSGPFGRATVRSSWIVLTGERRARMTSCYVL